MVVVDAIDPCCIAVGSVWVSSRDTKRLDIQRTQRVQHRSYKFHGCYNCCKRICGG